MQRKQHRGENPIEEDFNPTGRKAQQLISFVGAENPAPHYTPNGAETDRKTSHPKAVVSIQATASKSSEAG